MKRKSFGMRGFIFMMMAMIVFSGCEIAKGASRDIDKADQWMRDVAW